MAAPERKRRQPRRQPQLLKRRARLVRRKRLRSAPMVPAPRVAASPTQRAKVATLRCVVCERCPADPAHLVPQRLGGCGDPACCIPLCRACHHGYDHGRLRLRPYLAGAWRAELAHALTHVSPAALERALDGGGWAKDSASRDAP